MICGIVLSGERNGSEQIESACHRMATIKIAIGLLIEMKNWKLSWPWKDEMNKKEGVKEIDEVEWVLHAPYCWELRVHNAEGQEVLCSLTPRPTYCDRGHLFGTHGLEFLASGVAVAWPLFPQHPGLNGADSFPRFFFSFDEADTHTRLFLKWRLWKHRVHPHPRIPRLVRKD